MALISPFRRLKKEDFKEQGEWIEKLIQPLNSYMDSTSGAFNRGITFAQNLAAQVKTITFTVPDDWHYVGAPGGPAFENGWTNYTAGGANWANAAFRKTEQGDVETKGLVASGTLGAAIFTLPASYRVAVDDDRHFAQLSNSAIGAIQVYSNGQLWAHAASSNTWLGMESRFSPEDRTPPAFGSPFPLKVLLDGLQSKPQGVWVWQAVELGADLPIGNVSLDWKATNTEGKHGISIRRVNGVAPNKKYSLTFLAVAG